MAYRFSFPNLSVRPTLPSPTQVQSVHTMSYVQSTEWFEHARQTLVLSSIFLLSSLLLFFVGHAFHNIFLHPLRSYMGPLLWRMSRIPWDYHTFNGILNQAVYKIHKKYGPTVRIAPDELRFTQSQAFKDTYAHIPGKEELRKDPMRQQEPPNGTSNVLGANKENHSRYRRLFAHAF